MKKLMITALVAMAAVVLNAASIDWSVEKKSFKMSDGSTKPDNTVVYLMAIANDAAYTALDTALANGTLKESGIKTYTGYMDTANTTASPTSQTYAKASGTASVGDTLEHNYAIVVFDHNATDSKDYYMLTAVAPGIGYVGDPEQGNAAVFGADHFSENGWQVVTAAAPEPTSGLLLLLGVAGLALKRKRA